MQEEKVSATALAVANGIAILYRSKKYHHLIDPAMGEMSEMYVQEAVKKLDPDSETAPLRKQFIRSVPDPREGFAKTPEEAIQMLGGIIDGWPFQFAGRKAAVEAEVRDDIRTGKKQIVVLGAGFDTLANRLAREYPKVKFYVNDQAATQKFRSEIENSPAYVAKFGPPPANLIYFPDDLSKKDGLKLALEKLQRNEGLSREAKTTAVVSEAVFFYIPKQAIEQTFKVLHDFFGNGTDIIASFLDANKNNPVSQGLNTAGEPLFSFHNYRDVCELALRQDAKVVAYSPGAMLKKNYGCPDVLAQLGNPDSEEYYKFELVDKSTAEKSFSAASAEQTMHVQRVMQGKPFEDAFRAQNLRQMRDLLLKDAAPEFADALAKKVNTNTFAQYAISSNAAGMYITATDVPLMQQMEPGKQRTSRARKEKLEPHDFLDTGVPTRTHGAYLNVVKTGRFPDEPGKAWQILAAG